MKFKIFVDLGLNNSQATVLQLFKLKFTDKHL